MSLTPRLRGEHPHMEAEKFAPPSFLEPGTPGLWDDPPKDERQEQRIRRYMRQLRKENLRKQA